MFHCFFLQSSEESWGRGCLRELVSYCVGVDTWSPTNSELVLLANLVFSHRCELKRVRLQIQEVSVDISNRVINNVSAKASS